MNIMTGPDDDEVVAAGPRWRNLPRGRPKGSASRESTFLQRDLKQAIKAAKGAGLENFRVSVDKSGTISVVPMAPGESPADTKGANEWDEVLRKRGE